MFPYTDPVGTGRLEQEGGASLSYRTTLHAEYVRFARWPNSGFTLLDAFSGLGDANGLRIDSVSWKAFPLTATSSDSEIDTDRFVNQDEYVEWQVERASGEVSRVTFTTEFSEYYEALASVGMDALVRAIRDVYPNANPSAADLFGPGFNPAGLTPDARAAQFRFHLQKNPWNDGTRGILCLAQPFNTLGALFNLVGRCGVPAPTVTPANMCEAVSSTGACGPERASDPAVCAASQTLARGARALAFADPAGIRIVSLGGIWKVNGQQVDINNPANNGGAWTISRKGRRGVLDLSTGVTQGDDPVLTGAQVAKVLNVAADVISAPDGAVPAWAKLGQESSRVIV